MSNLYIPEKINFKKEKMTCSLNPKIVLLAFNTTRKHKSLSLACLKSAADEAFSLFKPNSTPKIEIMDLYTDNSDSAFECINKKNPEVIGFSIYCYNFLLTLELVKKIKNQRPDIKLIAGGPEVDNGFDKKYHLLFDYSVIGPGEEAFIDIIGKLFDLKPRPVNAFDIPLPQLLWQNTGFPDLTYYEGSRGCPFLCTFCTSSTTKKVISKPIEQIFKEISMLAKAGVKNILFTDRTFNIDETRFCELILFMNNLPGKTAFQIEIYPDLMTPAMIECTKSLKKGRFQFECGFQTSNIECLRMMKRFSKPEKGLKIMSSLVSQNNIMIHADLMTGLVGQSIEQVFTDIDLLFYNRMPSIQLNTLKVLPNTPLREDPKGIVYSKKPPYEVVSTTWISPENIQICKYMSTLMNRFYNSDNFPVTSLCLALGPEKKDSRVPLFSFFLKSIASELIKKKIDCKGLGPLKIATIAVELFPSLKETLYIDTHINKKPAAKAVFPFSTLETETKQCLMDFYTLDNSNRTDSNKSKTTKSTIVKSKTINPNRQLKVAANLKFLFIKSIPEVIIKECANFYKLQSGFVMICRAQEISNNPVASEIMAILHLRPGITAQAIVNTLIKRTGLLKEKTSSHEKEEALFIIIKKMIEKKLLY